MLRLHANRSYCKNKIGEAILENPHTLLRITFLTYVIRSLYSCLVKSRYGSTVSSYWHTCPPRQICWNRWKRNSSRSVSLKTQKLSESSFKSIWKKCKQDASNTYKMGMLFQNNNFLKNIGQKNKGHSNLISMILFKQIFLNRFP